MVVDSSRGIGNHGIFHWIIVGIENVIIALSHSVGGHRNFHFSVFNFSKRFRFRNRRRCFFGRRGINNLKFAVGNFFIGIDGVLPERIFKADVSRTDIAVLVAAFNIKNKLAGFLQSYRLNVWKIIQSFELTPHQIKILFNDIIAAVRGAIGWNVQGNLFVL